MAVKVPETLAHLRYWTVQLTRRASKEDVLAAFRHFVAHRLHPHRRRAHGHQFGEGAHG
jgi:glyceraldehyde-3-phosphate dehydrogenase/erythrose-4-phosphate dehydrogenase